MAVFEVADTVAAASGVADTVAAASGVAGIAAAVIAGAGIVGTATDPAGAVLIAGAGAVGITTTAGIVVTVTRAMCTSTHRSSTTGRHTTTIGIIIVHLADGCVGVLCDRVAGIGGGVIVGACTDTVIDRADLPGSDLTVILMMGPDCRPLFDIRPGVCDDC